MRGINNNSPRAAGAPPAVPDQDGPKQGTGKVASLVRAFEGIGVQHPNLSQVTVGVLGQDCLQAFQVDPRIKKTIELIQEVEKAIGKPSQDEPAYASKFKQTTINTRGDCIATLKDLKQWIIDNRLLHGKQIYQSDAREHCRNNPNFSETAIIKAATATEAEGLYEKLQLSDDEKTRSFKAIINSDTETIRNILSNKLEPTSPSFEEDFSSITRISRNLTHCELVKKIDDLLKTLSKGDTDLGDSFSLHLGPDVVNYVRGTTKKTGPSNE